MRSASTLGCFARRSTTSRVSKASFPTPVQPGQSRASASPARLQQEKLPSPPVRFGPAVRLALIGDGGLQGDFGVELPQGKGRLAEVQVRSPGHAADEMAEALGIGLGQGFVQPVLQLQATGIVFILSPGQPLGAVAGKTAGVISVHGLPPLRQHGTMVPPQLWKVNEKEREILEGDVSFGTCFSPEEGYNRDRQRNTMSSGRGGSPHRRYSPRALRLLAEGS